MLFQRLHSLLNDLSDPAQTDCEGPLVLVYNTGLESWALLDPFREVDCLQFFEDRRNTMLCVLTGDIARSIPEDTDLDHLEARLQHHAVNVAPSPAQIPLDFLLRNIGEPVADPDQTTQ